jgi:hypothetical protein
VICSATAGSRDCVVFIAHMVVTVDVERM